MSKTILVTVASEGIGFETARLSAARGDRELMVARNAHRLAAAAVRDGKIQRFRQYIDTLAVAGSRT
jgi:NAD(P)-dependent dehydrogenase (short-subunit alcohol dehydrogenase family)